LQNWSHHWQRLKSHANYFGYQIPSEQLVRNQIILAAKKNKVDLKIRVIIFESSYALVIDNFYPPLAKIYDGVEIIISTQKVHPVLAKYKTGNSLPYFLARKEAQKKGVFEAILTNEKNHLVDGSRCGLMMVKNNSLTILEGGLTSTMATEACSFAKNLGVEIIKAPKTFAEINGQLLLTSSLIGVVPVGSISNPLTKLLVDKYRQS
jgi:branched-subunit amino acid aminotransferase/4-amino-4-deoxychorismate lyase